MDRHIGTEVLVAGAGPAGMVTALFLAKAGIHVRVVDQATRTTSRTYACALHPESIALFEQLGLAGDILDSGRCVESVAFYEGNKRQAEGKLSQLQTQYPCVVVLAQSLLEQLLEEKLRKDFKVQVAWNHQVSDLRQDAHCAVAAVDRLSVSAKGYAVPDMDWSVDKTEEVRADYIVGADGPNSHVAKWLALGTDSIGQPEFFAVHEFESDWTAPDELRVAFTPDTTSVFWPLRGNKFRWSFQLLQEHLEEFPLKDRSTITIGDPALDEANRAFVRKLLAARAPWFSGPIEGLGWSTDVEFCRRLTKRFGDGRCWLVGDAAHQTGPAGMQSMNLGLVEAQQLANALVKILREGGSADLLRAFDEQARARWQQLLGMDSGLKPRPGVSPWVKEHRGRILSCLPSSGTQLRELLGQLQLDLT